MPHTQETITGKTEKIAPNHLIKAYQVMCYVRYMAATYDDNRSICKYVHSTSRGHEAIQIAAGLQLASHDCAAPYYRDEAMLLAMGWSPYELMLQLLAKADDPFSGGRTYYSHPANRGNNRPLIPHQSSATGMQVIPATGLAQGIKYIETQKLKEYPTPPVTLCSVGDGAMTEGEVSEALQFAVLKQLPIIYLVQDNDWGISVSSDEARAMDAYEYAAGFKGLNRMRVDGSDFILSWNAINSCIQFVRNQRKPILLHAKVPLLGHHTSGVRKEWYRSEEDLRKHAADDPFNKLEQYLIRSGLSKELITKINTEAKDYIDSSFEKAKRAPEP
ncbi:MAG: thiamine pyrophosphate-dependent dehydrogenase E1 component subunit alpha, partial [Bacteroidota bacterium]